MPLNRDKMREYMREYRKKHRALSGRPSKVDTRIGSLTPAQTVEYTEYLASRGKRLVNAGGANPMWAMEPIPGFVPGQYPQHVRGPSLPICRCGNPPMGMLPGAKSFRVEWYDGSVYEHSLEHCHHYSSRDVSYLERQDDRGIAKEA